MGYTENEYSSLSEKERFEEGKRVENIFKKCGANYIIKDLSQLNDIVVEMKSM